MKTNSPPYTNREFRSRKWLHIPAYIVYIRWVIHTWSLTRIYDANPGMPPTGVLKFSKWSILQHLPISIRPQTFLRSIDNQPSDESIKSLWLPLVCKPDGEERWKWVIIITSRDHRASYKKTLPENQTFLLQEYIAYPEEIGVFRYRDPNNDQWVINGITTKEFIVVVGDGQKTLGELVAHDTRAKQYTNVFKKDHEEKRNTIIPQWVSLQLNTIGNHNKWTKFLDWSDLITEKLTQTITTLLENIPDFYYGRLDLRTSSKEALQKGENIKIMEINGVQSEPTHLYDPKHTLRERVQWLRTNRIIILRIALKNRKQWKSLHIPFLAHMDKTYGTNTND